MAGEETTVRTSWADESEEHDEEISCPEGWVTPETRPLAEPQPQQKPSEQAPVRAWATVPASSQPAAAAEATAAVEEAVAPAQEFPSLGEAASPTKPEPAEQRPPQRYQRPSQQQQQQHYDRPPRRDFRESRSPRGEFVRTERPQNPVPENPPFEAYVGNLPYDVRDEELKRFFVERGECVVKEVRLLFDRATRRPKGFGYVTFGDRKSLVDALGLSGAELLNRRIRVDVATPDRERERDRDREHDRDRDRDREHDRDRDRDRGSRFGDRSWGSSGDRRPSPRDFGRDRDRDRAPPAQHQQQEQQEPPAERKKLELTPRSVEAPVGGVAEKPRTRPDPFGGAKPRDEAEVERRKAKEREAREKAEAEAKAKAADAQKKAAAEAVASAAAAAAAAAATTAVKPATVKPAAQQPSRPAPKPAATTKSGRDPRNPWGLGAKQDEKKKAANKNPFDALGDD